MGRFFVQDMLRICSQSYNYLPAGRDAGTYLSHLALIRPGNEASPLALRAQPGRKEQR